MKHRMISAFAFGTLMVLSISGVHAGNPPEVSSEQMLIPVEETAPPPKHKFLGKLRGKSTSEGGKTHPIIGCYSHFNDYTCSSFHFTLHFIFGSCRDFYGEVCLKGPPASPVPGFDPASVGIDPRNGGRCKGCR